MKFNVAFGYVIANENFFFWNFVEDLLVDSLDLVECSKFAVVLEFYKLFVLCSISCVLATLQLMHNR